MHALMFTATMTGEARGSASVLSHVLVKKQNCLSSAHLREDDAGIHIDGLHHNVLIGDSDGINQIHVSRPKTRWNMRRRPVLLAADARRSRGLAH